MPEIELPPLRRVIKVKVRTYGRAPKLGVDVYKLGKWLGLERILTTRGWSIMKETKDYLYAQIPADDPADDALTITVTVPTEPQVRDLVERVCMKDTDRRWEAQWGELVARYEPRHASSTQEVDPFTGERGERQHGVWIPAHFHVGAHGLFTAGVDDVGGENRFFERFEPASQSRPLLFDEARPGDDGGPQAQAAFVEGRVLEARLTRYERNHAARQACIAHWGTRCSVCGFDFKSVYGSLGAGFIEVHHVLPLAEIHEQYKVDPINDLRPVCSNCHAMLHRQQPPLTIEALRQILGLAPRAVEDNVE